ncbi:CCAAT- binding transcription factor component [Coemansia spiralis]|uniref:CCAAT- binding transcription factor component n=1 Tax=Coemansia spiralis TaxID=417178 RepID=A0A9W8L2C2_9FUNG|nr:CCAAT- binding transcription factor component [Coemansia spiralis]
MQGTDGHQSSDEALSQQVLHDAAALGKFNLAEPDYHTQSLASAVAAAAAASQQQDAPQRPPAPMYPGASTIPTNFSSAMINSPDSLAQFQTTFWKAHMASVEDNVPDFKLHLLPLARIKKVMKSDPDVKVQMISAEAPILFSKACEIFITEITQRAWMNAEENKRRTLQRQDVSCAAQRSEMFDFLIDVVPREEFAKKPGSKDEGAPAAGPSQQPPPPQQGQPPQQAQQTPSQQLQQQADQTAAAAAAAAQQQQVQQQALQQAQAQAQAQVQVQQSQQSQQAQPQSASSLYTDPAFHQYYAQHLAEAAGFPQAAGPTPEQRQAYYQQIEREQLQWLQRQSGLSVGQPGAPQQMAGQYSAPRLPSSHVSPQIQQQQQIHDLAGSIPPKSEHGGD